MCKKLFRIAVSVFMVTLLISVYTTVCKALPNKVVGLTIPVNFKDETSKITRQQIYDLMNKEGYKEFTNRYSIRDYFWYNSGGELDYTNIVTDFVTTEYNKSYYNDLSKDCTERGQVLAQEVLSTLKKQGYDFSGLTTNDENTVYALNILYAGTAPEGKKENILKGLWPSTWSLSTPFKVSDNTFFKSYQIANIGDSPQIATIIHENGHMVCGWPDTYDYGINSKYENGGKDSYGTASFDLMGNISGLYRCAPPPNPYFKNMLAGWGDLINLEDIAENTPITAKANSNDVYVYYNPKNEKEFFIIQNVKRDFSKYNGAVPASGMIIWHIDSSVGHNDFEYMTSAKHYGISVEQADGQFHLEKCIGGSSYDDVFNIGYKTEFGPNTTPSSKWWDGTDSKLGIKLFEKSGDDIIFSYSTSAKNISQGKAASQSSTYFGCDAFRAVDGNIDGNWNNSSITHTNSDQNAWWQVDLANTYSIDHIKIYNRTDACMDRLSNFRVSILNHNKTEVWSTNIADYPNPSTDLSVPNICGQYVQIQLNGTNNLSLAEVEVFGKENIAYLKPTSQSSTYFDCTSVRAVDGNTDGNWNSSSLSHTNSDQNAWWIVDFLDNHVFNGIEIYNRTDACMDRLSNYRVSILDKDGTEVWSSFQILYPYPVTRISVPNISGECVKIQLNGTGILSLAEVLVFGEKNVAFEKSASQSSDYFGCLADRATDGNTDGNWNNNSITHTNNDPNAWWQVDLVNYYYINGIRIFNRTDACMDRLNNYKVSILNRSGEEIWSTTQIHYPCKSTFISVPNIGGCYVKVQLNGTNNLSLAEVQVFGSEAYALYRGSAYQSSTYFGCDASRAIDGRIDGNWNNACITHTDSDTNAWWKVMLSGESNIDGIRIYNRTDACVDRLSNYKVTIYDEDGIPVWSKNIATYPNPYIYLSVPHRKGRYVEVQLNGNNYLSLAEVQVF